MWQWHCVMYIDKNGVYTNYDGYAMWNSVYYTIYIMCNVFVVLQVCCLSFPTLCLTLNFSNYVSWLNNFLSFCCLSICQSCYCLVYAHSMVWMLCIIWTYFAVGQLHLCCLPHVLPLHYPAVRTKEYYCIQNVQATTQVIMIVPIIPSESCNPIRCPGQHSDC